MGAITGVVVIKDICGELYEAKIYGSVTAAGAPFNIVARCIGMTVAILAIMSQQWI